MTRLRGVPGSPDTPPDVTRGEIQPSPRSLSRLHAHGDVDTTLPRSPSSNWPSSLSLAAFRMEQAVFTTCPVRRQKNLGIPPDEAVEEESEEEWYGEHASSAAWNVAAINGGRFLSAFGYEFPPLSRFTRETVAEPLVAFVPPAHEPLPLFDPCHRRAWTSSGVRPMDEVPSPWLGILSFLRLFVRGLS